MKMLFRQRMFSWFDSYDIFDEAGSTLYTVKGELALGHQFRVYDQSGLAVGCVKQRILSFLPRYDIYKGNEHIGCICKEFSFFRPHFTIDFCGWSVQGDWFEWDYTITNALGSPVATINKELWNWTDTYSIEVSDQNDALYALMLVLAIDANKCSRDN
ncbi:MAG: LURP-one-related family protein [Clostridia bacterium]|nr:LURP-one-related family protein [Clostridia bacterium]